MLIPFYYFAYLGFKRYPVFIWAALINLLSFSLIAHKELSKIFQFHPDKDSWCGGGYTHLNIDAPYNSQNCWENSEKFLTKNESNLENSLDKPKVIITDKNKFLLGGQKLYCDNKFCAYAYYNQINNTKYYLWKVLPFYI